MGSYSVWDVLGATGLANTSGRCRLGMGVFNIILAVHNQASHQRNPTPISRVRARSMMSGNSWTPFEGLTCPHPPILSSDPILISRRGIANAVEDVGDVSAKAFVFRAILGEDEMLRCR